MTSIADKLDILKDNLKQCRTNITSKGGYIYSTAGFKTVAEKILTLPTLQNVGTLVDNSVAYRKEVPANSVSHCYLNSIGGMTYKGFTFDCTVIDDGGMLCAPYSFTFPKEFALPDDVSGYWAFEPVVVGFTNGAIGDLPMDYTISGRNMSGQGYGLVDIPVGTQLRCIPRFVDTDSSAPNYRYFYPPECYTDLRDAKPTEVVSYGANCIPYPYSRQSISTCGVTIVSNADGSITINGQNDGTGSAVLYLQTDLTLKAGTYTNCGDVDMSFYDGVRTHPLVVGVSKTFDTDVTGSLYIYVLKSDTTVYDNKVFHPMLVRGTTAVPFKLYREPKTYTLPTAITNNLGKGCSDTLFDEYSFVDEKVITRVGQGAFENIDNTYNMSNGRIRYRCKLFAGAREMPSSLVNIPNKITMPFLVDDTTINDINTGITTNKAIYKVQQQGTYVYIYLPQAEAPDAASFNAWIAKYPLDYIAELEVYTEEAVTDTDFNPLIEVEAGGYLEFVNEYGYAVPSTVTFQIVS